MSILRQRVRSAGARHGPTAVPLVQKREARAIAVDVYGQLAGNHEGKGSHRKEGEAAKPGLSRQDRGRSGGQAPRLTAVPPFAGHGSDQTEFCNRRVRESASQPRAGETIRPCGLLSQRLCVGVPAGAAVVLLTDLVVLSSPVLFMSNLKLRVSL